MKKGFVLALICVIFVCCFNIQPVFAFKNEKINFYYNNQIFTYSLEENLKYSTQFDINYKINKYKRFSSTEQRKYLLQKMINIGFDYDKSVNYIFPNVGNVIKRIERTINIKPQNAVCTINSNLNNVFQVQKEVVGISVNTQEIYKQIVTNYLNDKELNIEILTTKINPEITQEQFKHIYLRSDFSTSIDGSTTDRKHNIKNALNSLNKIEILPNQVFSFNNTIGRRTPQNGYRTAKIIVNNEFVEGFGGGVCQVSSTLYNAALLAGLDILEANKHSKQVGYVKYGFDAMVNFGSSDLKFKNNTNQKLTIITNYANQKIRVRIFGENMNGVSYKLRNEILNIEQPTEECFVDENNEYVDKVTFEDEFYYIKKPSVGMDVKSYREKYVNNILQSTELLRYDKFKVQNGVKVYGKQKANI